MEPAEDQNILKKIYFIKRAAEGEELVTLLKNKFKIIDAIRDLLIWCDEGRNFSVTLRNWSEEEEDSWVEQRVEIHQYRSQAQNNQSVLNVIQAIIGWLDQERSFDISLVPKRAATGIGFDINLN